MYINLVKNKTAVSLAKNTLYDCTLLSFIKNNG
jgi:hypothetical protein